MAIFNFDVGAMMEKRRKKAEQEKAEHDLIASLALGGTGASSDEREAYTSKGSFENGLFLRPDILERNTSLNDAVSNNQPRVDAALTALALQRAGLDPKTFSESQLLNSRRKLLTDNASSLNPSQRVNAANKLDVSSIKSEGGRTYDRFGDGGYLDFSPDVETKAQLNLSGVTKNNALSAQAYAGARANDSLVGLRGAQSEQAYAAGRSNDALAGLRGEQGDEVGVRLEALRSLFETQNVDPLLAADVANNKPVFNAEQVKVRKQDGTETLMMRTPRVDGGFDYDDATDDGELLLPPLTGGKDQTALQKDTAYISEVLNIPATEAVLFKLNTKSKTPEDAYASIVERIAASLDGVDQTSDEIKARADEVYAIARPGQPIPTTAAIPTTESRGAEGLLQQARDAVARGASAEAVKARLVENGIDPDLL